MNNDLKRDVIFWLVTSIVISVLMGIYFFNENPALLPLALTPLAGSIPMVVSVYRKKRTSIAINNISEFLFVNILFLGSFLVALFWMKSEYQTLKVICFIIYLVIGTYNVVYYIKSQQNKKENL
jgi:hypothetical protein